MDSTMPHQRLLGPRPMHDRLHSVDTAVLNNSPPRKEIDVRRWSEQPAPPRPQLPPRPYEQKQRELDEIYHSNLTYSNERPASMDGNRRSLDSGIYDAFSDDRPAVASSLTLIRRYDYVQSNVGKILASSKASDPVNLDIIGAGYCKFNDNGSNGMNGMSLEEQEQAVYRSQLQTVVGL